MTNASTLSLRDFGPLGGSRAVERRRAGPAHESAVGAPCLGLALLAGASLWAGLGSVVCILVL